MNKWKTARLVAYGVLIGTAGVKLLTSEDAKKVYTHVTAAVLRCSDEIVKTAMTLKENCEDIGADAKDINERRYAAAREREIADARALVKEAEEGV